MSNAPKTTEDDKKTPPTTDNTEFVTFLTGLAPVGEKLLLGTQKTNTNGEVTYVPTDTLPPNKPLYANTGSFIKARAEDGYLSASARNIEHCLFLMLDDIGTKSKTPMLEPTWKIETSPGNFQWGYAYAECPTKGEQIAALEVIIAAGYCDPGANNPVRWSRIPGSLNKKKGFIAKLHEFHPDRLFSLPQICAALGVVPGPIEAERTFAELADDGGDDVLAWLNDNKLVLNPNPTRDGWYEVECPAGHEHSDGRTGAGYHPADRGFKCLHSHGDQWNSVKFLQWVADQGGPVRAPGARAELLFSAVNSPAPATVSNESIASRLWMDGVFQSAGLNPDKYRSILAPLPHEQGAFMLKMSDGFMVEYQAGVGIVRRHGSPCPVWFGDIKHQKVIFATDNWFSAAALHDALKVPVICVEGWTFGEIVTEDGESARVLHSNIMAALIPGVEVRIVTDAAMTEEHRKRLATLRVLLLEEGASVKAFTLPVAVPTFGAMLRGIYPTGAPDVGVLSPRLFKGKDALLSPIADEDLAEAALSYTLGDADRFGKYYLDLTDRGAGSYILSKLGRGSFYFLEDKSRWVRWSKGEWHDAGKDPLQLINVAAHGYMHRADVLKKQIDALPAQMMIDVQKAPDSAAIIQAKYKDLTETKEAEVKALRGRAHQLSQTSGRANVLKDLKARNEVTITSNRFDSNPYLIGVANGVVELKTGALRPVTQEDMMLRKCPTRYVPGARHPKIEKFLREITSTGYVTAAPVWLGGDGVAPLFQYDAVRLSYLQRRWGAMLIGTNALTSFEILHGGGSNGKTVLAKGVEAALGKVGDGGYTGNAPAAMFMSQFRERDPEAPTPTLNRIQGSRILFMTEGKDTDHLNEQSIKAITGGDTMTSRGLYADAVETRPTFTPVLLTNHLPSIKAGGKALWDRLAPMQFMCRWRRVGNTDATESRLIPEDAWFRDEMAGDAGAMEYLLAWMIEGCVLFNKEGLCTVPPDVLIDIEKYKAGNDELSSWMGDEGWRFDREKETALKDVYASWSNWTTISGGKPVQSKFFKSRLFLEFPHLGERKQDNRVVITGISQSFGHTVY